MLDLSCWGIALVGFNGATISEHTRRPALHVIDDLGY